MNPSQRKAERLGEVEQLLLASPGGLTQTEIARRLGVNRSTVHRYIPSLPGHIYIDDMDGERWKVDRAAYLVDVRFNLNEAMAIHLATRLLATRMERQNPHAATALRKLGRALDRLAPCISDHLVQSADALDAPDQRADPLFLRSLETLTQAWSLLRKVRLTHCREDGERREFLFSPYFIEPYAVGQSVHVIGLRESPSGAILRTLKIERIEAAELLNDSYHIPADFSPAQLLKDAWGIWYTDAPPILVTLQFSARVAKRVLESRWHRSEEVELMADGGVLWRGHIAEPQEMLPWIRGWGADCHVLTPPRLREQLKQEAARVYAAYWEGAETHG